MGREIRMVPPDWDHPKKENGSYQPLYDEDYETACEEWYADCVDKNGKYKSGDEEYVGDPPDKNYYRDRKWAKEEATHFQVYETVSEGTPVTPHFATKEELIDHLCEHGDFWDQKRRKKGYTMMECGPWSRENAESFVKSEWAPSFIVTGGKICGPSEQGELLGAEKSD